jgi:hypothetical protein
MQILNVSAEFAFQKLAISHVIFSKLTQIRDKLSVFISTLPQTKLPKLIA